MKALMVGLGGIGQRHARNLRSLLGSDIDLVAHRVRNLPQVVTDRLDIEPGVTVEERYGIRSYADLEDALVQKPDIAFVCNPSSLHISVARALAEAGCHLFIEKPLSHSWEGVADLVNMVESRRLVSLVGYQMRFHPCLQRAHALLEQGAIGRVLAVRAEIGEYLPGWHSYEDYRQMYAARQDLGGGVILSQIHELDYLYWLFGAPRRVFALGGHLSDLEIDVEDTASTLLEYKVGGGTMPVHLHQDYVQRPASRTCQVIGSRGKIHMDLRAATVSVFDGEGVLTDTASWGSLERNRLFTDELRHFLNCVAGKERPIVSVRDGAESLRMALAAKESMATGQVVELDRYPL